MIERKVIIKTPSGKSYYFLTHTKNAFMDFKSNKLLFDQLSSFHTPINLMGSWVTILPFSLPTKEIDKIITITKQYGEYVIIQKMFPYIIYNLSLNISLT